MLKRNCALLCFNSCGSLYWFLSMFSNEIEFKDNTAFSSCLRKTKVGTFLTFLRDKRLHLLIGWKNLGFFDKNWSILLIYEVQKEISFNWLRKIGTFFTFLRYGRLYFLISWLKLGHYWHFWGTKGYFFWSVLSFLRYSRLCIG